MKIKDIRKFREFIKYNVCRINVENRNPHFAGSDINDQIFGLFNMLNGTAPIHNLLETILNMAGDSQAIYEFMQNAVDANSEHFLLTSIEVDGDLYLIVLNDGEYFSAKSVLSILSIGSSSKYRNPDNIGRYGIGFKLAHRLIGIGNSLEELLDFNMGPILFSWNNNEIINLNKIHAKNIELVDPKLVGIGKNIDSQNFDPWLFKIIATNFPCLPNDPVLDALGRHQATLFTDHELEVLKETSYFLKKNFVCSNKFKSGTLLIIPLEPKKKDQVLDKPTGIEISASILSKRDNKKKDLIIQIEDQEIKSDYLYSEYWDFTKDYFNNEFKIKINGHAEFMFIYSNNLNYNPFENKPQLYNYFPMSSEIHRFCFAIHCNTFDVKSQRINIETSELNSYLFKKIVELISQKLNEYIINDENRFKCLYSSILLSRSGNENDWTDNSKWLKDVFWDGLFSELNIKIPCSDNTQRILSSDKKNIFIKNSSLPLELWHPEKNIKWFLWELNENEKLCREAVKKIGIKKFSLNDLLDISNIFDTINEWLKKNKENSHKFLSEFSVQYDFNYSNHYIQNLKNLKLWWFENAVYSISDLTNENLSNYFLNITPIQDFIDYAKELNIIVCDIEINKYPRFKKIISKKEYAFIDYLYDYRKLIKLLNDRFELLNNSQTRVSIFRILKNDIKNKFGDDGHKLIKTISIFRNNGGNKKPLCELTNYKKLPLMLSAWQIEDFNFEDLELEQYFSNSLSDIYKNVIRPNWPEIARQNNQTSASRLALFVFVNQCYLANKENGTLIPGSYFFSRNGWSISQFYHPSLSRFSDQEYSILEMILEEAGYTLPQHSLIRFYSSDPFILAPIENFDLETMKFPLDFNNCNIILNWVKNTFPNTISKFKYIKVDSGKIKILKLSNEEKNYITSNTIIEKYINNYFVGILYKIPIEIASNFSEGVLTNFKIIEFLLHHNIIDQNSKYDLAKIVLEFGNDEIKMRYVKKVEQVKVDIQLNRDSYEYVLLQIIFSITNEVNRVKCIDKYLYVKSGNNHTRIGDIQSRGTDIVSYQTLQGKTIDLSIASLIGNSDIYNNNSLLDRLSHSLSDSGIAAISLIKRSLGINNQQNPEYILQLMIDTLIDQKITNETQLYFLLTNRYSDIINQYSFKLETKDGWVNINNKTFYLENLDFIPPTLKLSEKYSDIISLINGDFLIGNNFGCNIYLKPFINGENFVLPSIHTIDKRFHSSTIKYVYNLWSEREINKIYPNDRNVKWMSLIGFNPSQFILSDNFCLPKEIPSDIIRNHQDIILSDSFLISIGVNNSESDVVLTRKYFATGDGYFQLNLSPYFIINTLEWLFLNNINLKNRDIYPFFNHIFNLIDTSEYFPAFVSDKSGIYLIKLDSTNVFYLSREVKNDPRFNKYCRDLNDITSKCKISIIDISELSKWSNKIMNLINQLRIDWDEINIEHQNITYSEFNYSYYFEFIKIFPGYRIYKLSSLEIPKKIKINDIYLSNYFEGKVCVFKAKNLVNIYTCYFNVDELIVNLRARNIIHHDVINGLSNFYTKFTNKLNGFIEIAKNDVEFDKYISDRAEKLKLKQERSENARIVNDHNNKYSVEWFRNLLDLVKTNKKITYVPKITFCSFKHISDNVFEFYNSDRIIPSNIESYPELQVEISYTQNNISDTFNTNLSASIKHNKLWVLFPDNKGTIFLLNEANKIEQIVIKILQETAIIEELKNGFKNLNLGKNVNLKESLTENIDFIFGPPGTGKTTLLATNLINSFNQETGNYKILLTPTNKAADVVTKKIIEKNKGTKPDWLIRTGSCTDPFLLNQCAFVKSDQIFLNQHKNYLIVTTIHRFSYLTVRESNNPNIFLRLCNIKWNEVLFDESSMIPLPYIVYSIYAAEQKNNDTRFVIAGDPKQIPPVFDIEDEELDEFSGEELNEYNIYKMIGLHSFDPKMQQNIRRYGNRITNLTVQHRSIPAIGSLFGNFQYSNLLESSRGTGQNPKSSLSRGLPNGFDILGFKPITIIRFPVRSNESIYKPSKIDGSPIHIYVALIVNELIKFFKNTHNQQKDKIPWTIGVISPYRSQADLMSKMIENQSDQDQSVVVTTDTVHGFQGDENNIIISVFNPSGNGKNIGYSRFLKKEYILNVAISRAEDYLIMLMPDTQCEGWNQLTELKKVVELSRLSGKDIFTEIKSSDIEIKLKGNNNYFSSNTFSSAHQKVNIYGKPNLPFMIRLGDNTIDLHCKDE